MEMSVNVTTIKKMLGTWWSNVGQKSSYGKPFIADYGPCIIVCVSILPLMKLLRTS